MTARKHRCAANLRATRAVLTVMPAATYVQSESSEFFHAETPECEARANARNERRFLSLDLTYGHPLPVPRYRYLLEHGMTSAEYDWLAAHQMKERYVLGNDYYVTTEHLVRVDGSVVPSGEIFGDYAITKQYYDRDGLPMMHTEPNITELLLRISNEADRRFRGSRSWLVGHDRLSRCAPRDPTAGRISPGPSPGAMPCPPRGSRCGRSSRCGASPTTSTAVSARIAQRLGRVQNTVHEYRRRFARSGLAWPLPPDLDEAALEAALFARIDGPLVARRPVPDWAAVQQKRKRKGVTPQRLWREYKPREPDGYQSTQCCRHYHAWAARLEPARRQVHAAGEQVFVDYVGPTGPVCAAGATREAQVFVAALGASHLLYVEATWTQTLPD